MRKAFWAIGLVVILAVLARGDGPADNIADRVRPIPPLPKPMTPGDRADVEAGVAALAKDIAAMRTELAAKPDLLALLPDVEIYYNALRYPLIYNEPYDMKLLRRQITEGVDRAKMLREGKTPWVMDGGPRGYMSRIDGSVQPYVVGVPKSYQAG